MRKLTFAMNLSLDGYIAAPGHPRISWPSGEPVTGTPRVPSHERGRPK